MFVWHFVNVCTQSIAAFSPCVRMVEFRAVAFIQARSVWLTCAGQELVSRCRVCLWCKYLPTASPDEQPLSCLCKVTAWLLTEVRTRPGPKESAPNMELIRVSLENTQSFKALLHLLLPNGFMDWIIFHGDWEGKVFTRLQNVILEKIIDFNSLGNTVWNNGLKNWENVLESTLCKEAVEIPLHGIAILKAKQLSLWWDWQAMVGSHGLHWGFVCRHCFTWKVLLAHCSRGMPQLRTEVPVGKKLQDAQRHLGEV